MTVVAAAVLVAPRPSAAEARPSEATGAPAALDVAAADAQHGRADAGHVLWLVAASDVPASARAAFEEGLAEALAGERARHLLDERALREHVARQASAPLPACVMGLEPCITPRTLAFDALQLSLVVRARMQTSAASFEVSYEVVDRRGQVTRSAVLAERNPRELAFELVREIFDATGTVAFDTAPGGAAVELDGEPVGHTPLSTRLPIGVHRYRLELADHRVVEGTVEVGSASSRHVRHDLALLPGRLRIDLGAHAERAAQSGAVVLVNGVEAGPAGEPVELEPGNYSIEVRAEGYRSHHDTVRLQPGQEVNLPAALLPAPSGLGHVAPEAIAINRYGLRVGYEHGLQVTSFRNARARIGDQELEFRGFTEDGLLPQGEDLRRFVAPYGLRIDAHYSGERFGLTLLSLSYLRSAPDLEGLVEVRSSRAEHAVRVTDLSRLQLRPFQLTFRHFVENLVPTVEAGIGINFQWIEVEGDGLAGVVGDGAGGSGTGGDPARATLRQTEAFWTVGLGAQYFFTPHLSASLRYNVQSYFNEGLGVEHLLGIGVGYNFGNLFGVEAEPPGKL